jgi:hypothetical protein
VPFEENLVCGAGSPNGSSGFGRSTSWRGRAATRWRSRLRARFLYARVNVRAKIRADLAERLREELSAAHAPRLRRLTNATGVIVHTNLGRRALAAAALERGRRRRTGLFEPGVRPQCGSRGSRKTQVAALMLRLGGRQGHPLERCHRNRVVTRLWRSQKTDSEQQPGGSLQWATSRCGTKRRACSTVRQTSTARAVSPFGSSASVRRPMPAPISASERCSIALEPALRARRQPRSWPTESAGRMPTLPPLAARRRGGRYCRECWPRSDRSLPREQETKLLRSQSIAKRTCLSVGPRARLFLVTRKSDSPRPSAGLVDADTVD